ncbi:hypothetical protein XM38_008030 [Halomicronema hongdechloris C2206]|uniref:Uncharacterized protein n=1 Tax=Halomicronema hongdechloris C2206 TaxID=1641165 RepID=A0A1Z3HHX7_9CYAN|nr:hypothetical protein XM38_008030 [Halomicronema hongdechloris C2206]
MNPGVLIMTPYRSNAEIIVSGNRRPPQFTSYYFRPDLSLDQYKCFGLGVIYYV